MSLRISLFFCIIYSTSISLITYIFKYIVLYIYTYQRYFTRSIITPLKDMHSLNWNKELIEKPWLVWLSGLSTGLQTKGSLVQFPVRAHAWVVGQIPSEGYERGNYTLVFLSLSPFLPLSLKINFKIFFKKFVQTVQISK